MWGVLDYLCAGTRRAWRARKVHRAFAFGEGRADGALSRGSWGWAAELAGPMALKFDVGFSEDENLKWRKSMEVRACVLQRCRGVELPAAGRLQCRRRLPRAVPHAAQHIPVAAWINWPAQCRGWVYACASGCGQAAALVPCRAGGPRAVGSREP